MKYGNISVDTQREQHLHCFGMLAAYPVIGDEYVVHKTESDVREIISRIMIKGPDPAINEPGISIRKVRAHQKRNKQTWALNHGRLWEQKQAMLETLAESPESRDIVDPALNCTPRRPCNSRWCPECSDPKLRGRKDRHHADQLHQGQCNVVGTRGGSRSSNYQVAGGQRMSEPFSGLPTIMLHPVTINFTLVRDGTSLMQTVKKYRKHLLGAFQQLSPGAIVRGKFDLVLKHGDELNFQLPQIDLPEGLLPSDLPHELFGMLHAHFVVFDSLHTREAIGSIFRTAFPGSNRVCVRCAREDIHHVDGSVTQGVQGYLEYASLEKVELGLGDDSRNAVFQYARFDQTWTRSTKNIRFGSRTEETDTLVDPIRVTALEADRNFEWFGKDFSKLDFASYWPHHALRGGSEMLHEIHKLQNKNQTSLAECMLWMILGSLLYMCNSASVETNQASGIQSKNSSVGLETSGNWVSGCPP